MLGLVEIGPVVFWRRFLNAFLLIYFRMEKDIVFHQNKRESPLPKDMLCQIWLKLEKKILKFWNWLCGSWEEDFKNVETDFVVLEKKMLKV